MQTEPVLSATTIGAIVGAILALLVEFGLDLTNGQIEAVLLLSAVLAPVILSAVYARGRVKPLGTDRRGPDGANPDEMDPRP